MSESEKTLGEFNQLPSLLQQLKAALVSHDWYYHHSDDHRAWKRGCDQAADIQLLLSKCDESDLGRAAKQLYNAYQQG